MALSISLAIHSGTPVTPKPPGHPHQSPPTPNVPFIIPSAPLLPTHPTPPHAMSVSPSGLYHSPSYFVRSGYIHLPYGTIRSAGDGSVTWSSTAQPANIRSAPYLYFLSDTAYPSYIYTRYVGQSLRKPHLHQPTKIFQTQKEALGSVNASPSWASIP